MEHPLASVRGFGMFVGAFYCAWILRVVLLLPVDASLHDVWIKQAWSQGLRIALWVVPVLVYLRMVEGIRPIEFLKLNAWPRGRRLCQGAAITVGFLLAVALIAFVFEGHSFVGLHGDWQMVLVQMSIVAMAEEVLFRGFIYQKLEQLFPSVSRARPVVMSSVLFVLAHVPGWLYMQGAQWSLIPLGAGIFIIACVLAILFNVTRSLWPPIVLHLLNNLLSAALSA